jgi:glycerate 2-kinase
MRTPAREAVRPILDAALAAVDPRDAVRRALRWDDGALAIGEGDLARPGEGGRIWLIAAGKAAAGMALGALDVLGDAIAGGTVTVPHGTRTALPPRMDVWEAAHPVPDAHGLAGAVAALEVARGAGEGDVVLCLLSGGASALWPAPVAGVSLSELAAATHALLRAGAPIAEVNAVRKHLSRIAGGRLAQAAAAARVVTLVISDVVGSPLDAVASGPTVPDPTTYADALEVLRRYGAQVPAGIIAHLQAGDAGAVEETPKPADATFLHASTHVIARNRDALDAAAQAATALGWNVTVEGDDMEGEARDVAAQVAALAWGAHAEGTSALVPHLFLLGGETTVTVTGDGRGGRNQELALALAIELDGEPGVTAACIATDGRDGPTDAAGAVVDGTSAERARSLGLDPHDHLHRNDSHPLHRATGDLLVTGPTGTNVNDLILLFVDAPGG